MKVSITVAIVAALICVCIVILVFGYSNEQNRNKFIEWLCKNTTPMLCTLGILFAAAFAITVICTVW